MNNSAAKVGEIFREAGTAFNRLSEMIMLLHPMEDPPPGGKWSDEEVEMLRGCVNRFAVELNRISQHIKNRTMKANQETNKQSKQHVLARLQSQPPPHPPQLPQLSPALPQLSPALPQPSPALPQLSPALPQPAPLMTQLPPPQRQLRPPTSYQLPSPPQLLLPTSHLLPPMSQLAPSTSQLPPPMTQRLAPTLPLPPPIAHLPPQTSELRPWLMPPTPQLPLPSTTPPQLPTNSINTNMLLNDHFNIHNFDRFNPGVVPPVPPDEIFEPDLEETNDTDSSVTCSETDDSHLGAVIATNVQETQNVDSCTSDQKDDIYTFNATLPPITLFRNFRRITSVTSLTVETNSVLQGSDLPELEGRSDQTSVFKSPSPRAARSRGTRRQSGGARGNTSRSRRKPLASDKNEETSPQKRRR